MTFVIAEAGSCHAGSLVNAKRLIDLAYNVGAQACKFQYCSDYILFAKRRWLQAVPHEIYPFSIRRDWLPELHAYCGERIEFMCSTFLPEDIAVVAPYVRRFKISAYEAKDEIFIGAHFGYGKQLIISCRDWEHPITMDHRDYELLHCVSEYPCPDNQANLYIIRQDEDLGWSGRDGLSDHTKNALTGAMAVACGAKYIETHFRLFDTPGECPDFQVARNPDELDKYIRLIREAEVLLG